MELKLNANSLIALIKDDDEFKLSLQRSVIKSVLPRVFPSDVEGFAKHLDEELIEELKMDEDMKEGIEKRLRNGLYTSGTNEWQEKIAAKIDDIAEAFLATSLRKAAVKSQEDLKIAWNERLKRHEDEMMNKVNNAIDNLHTKLENHISYRMNVMLREVMSDSVRQQMEDAINIGKEPDKIVLDLDKS